MLRLLCCGGFCSLRGVFRIGALCSLPRDNGLSRCPWPLRHIGPRVPTKILSHELAPLQGGITCAILCFCMPNPCCDFRQAEAVGATRVETARSKLLRVPVPINGFSHQVTLRALGWLPPHAAPLAR